MLPRFANNNDPQSWASRLRLKRSHRFAAMVESLPRPLRILDVGGTQTMWAALNLVDRPDIQITLLNILPTKCSHSNVAAVIGDARNMRQFEDGEFDLVYSNSVIEHVGDFAQMKLMANEVQRVAKHYFLQTPYCYFPIEPHFVFPLFQFLPFFVQVHLVRHFSLGWFDRLPDREEAKSVVRSIRLLSRGAFHSLFHGAEFDEEKLFGVTKSLLAWKL